ncbi:MAG: response regulator [Oscillospiraceae bacterium]|nr:response regulator [Oscillospiraceae bacterium]
MKKLNQFINNHFTTGEISFESRTLNFVTVFGAIASIIALISRIIAGMPFISIIPLILMTAAIIGVFIMSIQRAKHAKILTTIIVCGVSFVFWPILFATAGSANSGMAVYFALAIILCFTLMTGKMRILALILTSAIIVFCYVSNIYHGWNILPSWPQIELSSHQRFIDIMQSIFIVGFLVSIIIMFQTHLYHNENRKVEKANSDIKQNEELLTLINNAAVVLLTAEADKFEEALVDSMRNLAECLDIDCIYIWRVVDRDGISVYQKLFQWLVPDSAPSTVYEAITGSDILERFTEWDEKLLGPKGYLSEPASSFTGFLGNALTAAGIRHIMAFPVSLRGVLWGFVSFENRHSEVFCTEQEAAILQSGSLLLANAVERHESTQQLNEKLVQLQLMDKERADALEKALQASRAKGDFLSNMSHEIRTPMNAIIGMTAIGMAATDIDRMQYAFLKIEDASKHLLGVINDILDISKIEANKLELSPISFDFEKMLQNVVNIINFRVDEKKQRFFVNISSDIPRVFIGDDQRLAQAITNLLSNAVKFTPEGGTITLDTKLMSDEDGQCRLMVSVEDTGIGISPDQKSRLFNSFEQAEAGTTRQYGGTGLGLAITKRIVELMNGDIWVESEPDKGSKFIFTVMLTCDYSEKGSLLAEGVNWSNIRIFAVDDEPEVREFFQRMADSLGISCIVAASGEEAAQLLAEDDGFDIYFLDWILPGISGIELAKLIQSKPVRKSIVVIFSSADWSIIEDAARNAGVEKFLPKPLFPSMIVDLINECIGSEVVTEQFKRDDEPEDYSGRVILLAEDVEINREIVQAMLEPMHLTMDFAENGAEAVDAFVASPGRYDMIFMDVQMPILDGYEATRRIRALKIDEAKSVPIIAMTANVFRDDVERCLDAGMDGHLGKPLDMDEVRKALKQYL